jgi:endonuclease III
MSIEEKLRKESFDEYNKKHEIILVNGDNKNELVSDLKNYPHAFVLACIMDRQITAERAWSIPYELKEIIGTFDINSLYNISIEEYKKIFKENNLHRFNDNMASVFYNAVHKIVDEYDGVASNIWKDNPSSATVVSRLLDFDGVGIKIATMATNILSRDFKIKLSDYYSIDISPDVHVKRVFKRMGLVKDIDNVDKIIYKARSISPEFPGILDLTCWKLGKDICRPNNPKCSNCSFNIECPKLISEDDK